MLKNNKGFSLIEVLVTVGLIGVLVGIAVPSYNNYKKNTVEMALKADLGSGAKVYNAKYAVESTFCYTFEDVGLPTSKLDNPIYKKGGFFGFGKVGTDCATISKSDVQWQSDDKSCYDSSSKTWSAPTPSATPGGTPTCGSGALKSQKGLEYQGGDPIACVLDSNLFLLGATTNTSSVSTFYYANSDGTIKASTANAPAAFNCN